MHSESACLRVPSSFGQERRYVCSVIFQEFLDFPCECKTDETLKDKYILDIGEASITIGDHFFSHCSEKDGYLHSNLIPQNILYYSGPLFVHEDLPVFYGKPVVDVQNGHITCGIDIFASIFFMLARWEECVLTERDYLGRFPASVSLACRFDLLHRPLVNEWVELLKNMIEHVAPSLNIRAKQRFEIVFTHDIDLLSSPVSMREFAKDIVKRKSISAFVTRAGYLLNRNNPYDVFDYYMDVSEKHGTLSRFYFMTGHNLVGKDGENYNNTRFYRHILNHIINRGHIVGFHPSLFSYNDPQMFEKEKRQLESDASVSVLEGRQHALRFSLPETWKMWDDHGMSIDSTLGYSAKEGFRCGTGNRFSVFDVKQRKHLRLRELPLIVMDTTLNVNRKLNIKESKQIIAEYLATGKKYDMPITLLFHNLINEKIDWQGWKGLYDELFVSENAI